MTVEDQPSRRETRNGNGEAEAVTASLPFLGAGISYRRRLKSEIMASPESIDFLEIVTEQFMRSEADLVELVELSELFQTIPHGLGLSVGSAAPIDRAYLKTIRRISDITGSPYYSDHLAITRVPGIEIGHLSPIWLTKESLKAAIENVRVFQGELEKPLILENITYMLRLPGSTMTLPEFFGELVAATRCGILLDLTNLFTNSINYEFDPLKVLELMPLDNVVQVHIAGGKWDGRILIDSHSEVVTESVWSLLSHLAQRARVRGVVLEHDTNFPDDPGLLFDQIARARQILRHSR